LKSPTVKRRSSNKKPDPGSRLVATDFDNDPLQSFAPENRQDEQPGIGAAAPTAGAMPRLFDPQAIAGFGVFVDAINDVEKQLGQQLAAVERQMAALDERTRHNEERLTGFETVVAETRANVRTLDDSIETRVAKETRVAQQEATSYRVDSPPSRAPRHPRWSGRQSLLAVGVVAVTVLGLAGIVTMRSRRGDVNQIAARTTDPQPPPPAPTSAATPLVPAASPDPAPAILTASAVPAAPPVPTASAVELPTAAPADPPRPRRVAAPTSRQVATPQTEEPPANRDQARTKPSQGPIERRGGVFLGTLAVRSAPDGAAVFLNGREVGTTPLKLPGVRAGSYALRIEHEGYQRWTMSVLVPADKQTDINAKLDTPDVRWR
jgi:hypothetical protein